MRAAICIALLSLCAAAPAVPVATGPQAENYTGGDAIGDGLAGFDGAEGMLVLNEFTVLAGADDIMGLRAQLGKFPAGEGTLTALVFVDPTDNTNAGDAILKDAVPVANAQPGGIVDVRFRRPIQAPPGERFLVGFYAAGNYAKGFPCVLDRDATAARGWVARTRAGGPQFGKPLSAAFRDSIALVQSYGLTGAWAITATARPQECSVPVFSNVPGDVILPAEKDCFATVQWAEPSVHDDCTTPTVNVAFAPGDAFRTGTTRVEYTSFAWGPAPASAGFDVTVTESEPPVLVNIPADILARAHTGSTAVPQWKLPEVFDECSTTTLSASHTPGAAFPIGETLVSFRAVDAFGNAAEAEMQVAVREDLAPIIACPPTLFIAANGAAGAFVHFDIDAVDDFTPAPQVVSSPPTGAWFPIGRTRVLAVATDDLGTTANCSFEVVVGEPGRLEAVSIAAEDGELRESAAGSGVGGLAFPGNSVVMAGDVYTGQQRRALLSFDTSSIPAGAAVSGAKLQLYLAGVQDDPAVLGNLVAEGKRGVIGSSSALAPGDFEAETQFAAEAALPASPGFLNIEMPPAMLEGGALRTQVRMRFAVPTDGDALSDAAVFAAGESARPEWRPRLVVEYLWFPPAPSATPTPVPIDAAMRRRAGLP